MTPPAPRGLSPSASLSSSPAPALSDGPPPARPQRLSKSKGLAPRAPPTESPLSILAPNFVLHPSAVGLGGALGGPAAAAAAAAAVTRTSIYSLDMHPDGTRVVTGGNDHFVRLWSMDAILSSSSGPADQAAPSVAERRERFAAKRHDGGVMCVRWSHAQGSLLASGADDGSLVIWQLHANTPVTVPGLLVGAAAPVTYPESLVFVRKLPSMASDVIDLAWSHDNRFLAACSLDNAVVVFDGVTLDRVARCLHTSFVKGVAFDPVGTYLVSQSDDGTARFWNTRTWAADCTVSHPFLQGDTGSAAVLVRRPSFAPDGSYVGVANAVSNGVHVAALLPRNRWTYPSKTMYLVGHSAPICVAKFAPVLMSLNRSAPTSSRPAAPVLALGANDRKISIWLLGAYAQPRLVLDAAVESDITDLTWSPDGRVLLASSHEGRVVGVRLPDDLCLVGGPAVPADVVESLLVKAGRRPDRAHPVDQSQVGSSMSSQPGAALDVPGRLLSSSPVPTPQRVTTTKDGRKRIQPMLVAAFAPLPGTQPRASAAGFGASDARHDRDRPEPRLPPGAPPSATAAPARRSRLTMTPPRAPRPSDAWTLGPLATQEDTLGFQGPTGLEVRVTQRSVPVYLSVSHRDTPGGAALVANLVLDAPVHAVHVGAAHVAVVTSAATFLVVDVWLRRVTVRASLAGVVRAGDDEDAMVEVQPDPRNPAGMPLLVVGENCVVRWDVAIEGFVGVEVDE